MNETRKLKDTSSLSVNLKHQIFLLFTIIIMNGDMSFAINLFKLLLNMPAFWPHHISRWCFTHSLTLSLCVCTFFSGTPVYDRVSTRLYIAVSNGCNCATAWLRAALNASLV